MNVVKPGDIVRAESLMSEQMSAICDDVALNIALANGEAVVVIPEEVQPPPIGKVYKSQGDKFRPTLAQLDDRSEQKDLVLRRGSGLESLKENGQISEAEYQAAHLWGRDYETGIHGASDPERGNSGRRGDIHDMMIARSAATSRYRSVERALGKSAVRLLFMLVIDGSSISRMATELGWTRDSVKGAVKLLLAQLVEHFDEMPGSHWK